MVNLAPYALSQCHNMVPYFTIAQGSNRAQRIFYPEVKIVPAGGAGLTSVDAATRLI